MRKITLAVFVAVFTFAVLGNPLVVFAGTKYVTINSIPSGAKISANGQYIGITPITVPVSVKYWYELSEDKRPFIKAEKSGYLDSNIKLNPTKLNLPFAIWGMCCAFPWLWAFELPDTYTVHLVRKQ